ncbi:MAG: tRNA (N(6)-L-threonylcarbamoyladenosine(37)-C(2))-methylthiotransferase MtaB [Abditibacteriota bacterium]|nr:tRNA (N(6)-L-threonylcarbamoyladenosine(37)-C(2))-methylthiotransferase MtaB [Abditibacteriota bacterium]
MTVSFYTLGCKVNQYETEKIRALFEQEGFITVPFSEGADICVINTCTVTGVADGKSRAVIRKAKHINPETFVVVTGCYSQTHKEEVEALEECDLVVDIKDKLKILYYIKSQITNSIPPSVSNETATRVGGSPQGSEKSIDFLENGQAYRLRGTEDSHETEGQAQKITLRQRTRAVLKVQDGCHQFCSYCLIPFARKELYSEPIENVIEEVQNLCDNNYKEIILTGIRLGSYNYEGNDLSALIKIILEKTSIEKIRLSSIEMWEIDDKLLELMSDRRLCNHLHIPLQQGTDQILKLMNRPYTSGDYFSLIEKIRNKIPDIGITTDVIAGFPQETDELFEQSCDFITKVGFSRLHVFKYSRRPGTGADKMEGQIEPGLKKDRVNTLTEIGEKLSYSFGKKHINKDCEMIFVQKKKDGFLYGYTDNYMEVMTDKPYSKNVYMKLKPKSLSQKGVLIL